ncbi:hypothetical protein MBLNU230_g0626t1 [Neophaeotheca triangularis]
MDIQAQTPTLFGIAQEVRDQIFDLVLHAETGKPVGIKDFLAKGPPGILAVNRQARSETYHRYWDNIVVTIDTTYEEFDEDLKTYLPRLNQSSLPSTRKNIMIDLYLHASEGVGPATPLPLSEIPWFFDRNFNPQLAICCDNPSQDLMKRLRKLHHCPFVDLSRLIIMPQIEGKPGVTYYQGYVMGNVWTIETAISKMLSMSVWQIVKMTTSRPIRS